MGAYFITCVSPYSFSDIMRKDGEIERDCFAVRNHGSDDDTKSPILTFFEHDFIKFAESFYFGNFHAQQTYQAVKDAGEKGLFAATVCDYDNQNKRANKLFISYPTCSNEFVTVVQLTNKTSPLTFSSGYFICHETREYIDFLWFANIKNKSHVNGRTPLIFSPLHVLTRREKEEMGGGDAHFSEKNIFGR